MINETWRIRKPDELLIKEVKRDGRVVTYNCTLKKNGFILGDVLISNRKMEKYQNNETIIINGDSFILPHPWEGREDIFLPNGNMQRGLKSLQVA